jgi:hypothetical protein
MTTITMPRELDSAIQQISDQAKASCVVALAERYGFDPEEAHRFLAETSGVKLVKKRGPAPKPKAAKAAKGSGDEVEKPKRRPTGYLLFSADERAAVKAELTEALEPETKLAPQAVVKALAARWKALEQEERDSWNEVAKEELVIEM